MILTAGRRSHDRTARGGAIAQLGERVVRNDEVGGSIPPGSTTLRLRLRVAQPRKPNAKRARRSPFGRRRASLLRRLQATRANMRLYSAASDMIDSGMRLSQPSMNPLSHTRSVT